VRQTVAVPGTVIESRKKTVGIERFSNVSAAVRVVVVSRGVGEKILEGRLVVD
jgi:hypothetical protein